LAANLEIADADEAKAAGWKTGAIALKLAGSEGSGENASRLTASLSLTGPVLDFGTRGLLQADVDVDATLVAGSNKIQVDRLQVKTGRSTFDFVGSVGPKPPSGAGGEEPSYRYDLTSDSSTLALDSPSRRLPSRPASPVSTKEPQVRG
jgi:hypothetical protein